MDSGWIEKKHGQHLDNMIKLYVKVILTQPTVNNFTGLICPVNLYFSVPCVDKHVSKKVHVNIKTAGANETWVHSTSRRIMLTRSKDKKVIA